MKKKSEKPPAAPGEWLMLNIALPPRAAALFKASCAVMGETEETASVRAIADYAVGNLQGKDWKEEQHAIHQEPPSPEYAPPPATPKAEPEKHVVTLELSPGAYASLVILKEYEGHASVEDAIRDTVLRLGVQSLFEQVLGQEGELTMLKWFGLPEAEQES